MEVPEPQFQIEYDPTTNEVMFNATYPAGHQHRTSMDVETLDFLLAQGRIARQRFMA